MKKDIFFSSSSHFHIKFLNYYLQLIFELLTFEQRFASFIIT